MKSVTMRTARCWKNMAKTDLKRTISRGYTRKVNPSNHGIKGAMYESVDFFANYSVELPADTASDVVKKKSEELYELARTEVEDAVVKYLFDRINNLPRKRLTDQIDTRKKAELDFIEDLSGGIDDLG